MSVTKISTVQEGIDQMIVVSQFNAGYHYSNEAEADSIGEPSLAGCVEYHAGQAKLWEAVTKELQEAKHQAGTT